MAITATFTSDWSQFIKGTKEAEAALDKFEAETEAAGGAITKMAGTSKKAEGDIAGLTQSYRQFDGALAAAGINIGPAVRGLEDLSAAAGKSFTQIGLLGTVGLVIGTFTAAFQGTRAIIDRFFPGLDDAIARNVSSFLGWGDVGEQEAAAVADAIALASQRAGREITTLDEAVRVNTEWLKKRNDELKKQKKAEEDAADATARVAVVMQNHKAVLETIEPATRIAAEAELRHGAAARDVALAHQLSAAQIAAVVDKNKQHEEQLKKVNAQLEENKKKQQEATAAIQKGWEGVGAIVDKVMGVDALKKATDWTAAIDAMGGSVNHLRKAELEELHQTMYDGIDALVRSGQLTSQQSSEFGNLAIAAAGALEALKPVVKVTEDLAKAQWDYVTALDEEARAQQGAADAAKQASAAKGGGGFQAGLVPNAIIGRSGVALDMFGRPVVAGGGISQLPVVNVSVDGNIIGTEAELARLIGNAMTGHYSKGGNRLPV